MLARMRRFAVATLALGLLWPTPTATCWEGEIVRPKPRPRPKRIRASTPAARRPVSTRTERLSGGVTIEMVRVSAGTFTMGSTNTGGEEHPPHTVTISRPFYIGTYEVTQAQWAAVMGSNPSYFRGDTLPVEQVSWDDVQEFLRRLNSASGGGYRLPTEAEWEYACRAGTTRDSDRDLDATSWFGDNSGDWRQRAGEIWSSDQPNYNRRLLDNRCRTHPVGTKRPNAWGLYDMRGNVREWCQDWYGPYSSGPRTNPSGAMIGSYRVRRGGCWWSSTARDCDSSSRSGYAPGYRVNTLGLRLVRTAR